MGQNFTQVNMLPEETCPWVNKTCLKDTEPNYASRQPITRLGLYMNRGETMVLCLRHWSVELGKQQIFSAPWQFNKIEKKLFGVEGNVSLDSKRNISFQV